MNEIYELAIESAEVELLLTEGFADKAKTVLDKIIKKISDMINKLIVYIKNKLAYKIKQVQRNVGVLSKRYATDRNELTATVPKLFIDFRGLFGALDDTISDKLDLILFGKEFDINDIDFSAEIDAIKDYYGQYTELPIGEIIRIIDSITRYTNILMPAAQDLLKRVKKIIDNKSNLWDKTDYDILCITAAQKIVHAINALIMFIDYLSEGAQNVLVNITNDKP